MGSALRIAPARDQKPAAHFWKIWSSGSDVYATKRISGGFMKISTHESGQIHVRFKGKDKQDLAPPLSLDGGRWRHSFELRFLLGEDAGSPPPETVRKPFYLLNVPPNSSVVLNLVVGEPGTSIDSQPPPEFTPRPMQLWRATLKNGRPALLLGRVLDLDDRNRALIDEVRSDLHRQVNLRSVQDEPPYAERTDVFWDAVRGNVVCVIPMGLGVFRYPDPPPEVPDIRSIRCSSPGAIVPIHAPNGAQVAELRIDGTEASFRVPKNVEVAADIGCVGLRLNPATLIAGSAFTVAPYRIAWTPTFDGAQASDWVFTVTCEFDGDCLKMEVLPRSCSLRTNKAPMPALGAGEELLVSIPAESLCVSASLTAHQSSVALSGRLLIRDA